MFDRYPLILSIENHLDTEMQEKFAKMIKEKLGGEFMKLKLKSQSGNCLDNIIVVHKP